MKLEEKDKNVLLEFRKEMAGKKPATRETNGPNLPTNDRNNLSHTLLRYISRFNQLRLVMLFHPFPTNIITVRPHFLTTNSVRV